MSKWRVLNLCDIHEKPYAIVDETDEIIATLKSRKKCDRAVACHNVLEGVENPEEAIRRVVKAKELLKKVIKYLESGSTSRCEDCICIHTDCTVGCGCLKEAIYSLSIFGEDK